MKPDIEKFFTSWVTLFALLILAGCAGPLALDYKPSREPPFKLKRPATLHIVPFTDSRETDDKALAGTINEPVSDMTGTRLILAEDVSAVVTDALREEFSAAGFTVWVGPEGEAKDAALVLTGEVKKFWLHIGPRDEVEIELSSKITDGKTEKVLWSGVTGEKGDRFAGVTGNTRKKISEYLSKTLEKAIKKIVEEGTKIAEARAAGTTVAPTPVEALTEGTGTIVITTDPPRAKVYVGDVYYGLSPISIDLKPGIYEVHVKLKGFKTVSEKVAIRKGVTVELEVEFEE